MKSRIHMMKMASAALMVSVILPAFSLADDPQSGHSDDKTVERTEKVVSVEAKQFRREIVRSCQIGYGGAVPLLAPMDGVLMLTVNSGESIAKGDVIGHFSTRTIEQKLGEVSRDINYLNAEIDYRSITYLENLSAIHALDEVEKSTSRDHLAAQVADMKRLYGKGRLALGRFQEAQRKLDAADAVLEQARRRHEMEMREAKLKIVRLENDLARQQAVLDNLQAKKRRADMRAPVSGRLLDLETAAIPGHPLDVHEGRRIALLVDPGMMGARLIFDRREMHIVRNAGIHVVIENSDQTYDARILSVQSRESEPERRFGHFRTEVEIGFAAREGAVPPGAGATCHFTQPDTETAPAVPVAAIRMGNGENYVEKVEENGSERVRVELGEVSENYARVLSGLKPGDRVLE